MVSITAQQILDENNYSQSDTKTKTNVEYLIDNTINYINLLAGTSISNMTGTAPNKTVTVSSNQSAVIKPLVTLMLKAYFDRGPNVAVANVSVATMLQDPQYALFKFLLNRGIERLRGRSFERV